MPCKYATAPVEMQERSNLTGKWRDVPNPDRFLCSWADYHPNAVEKLSNTPPWLQRNALAGHLMQKGDCERCPLYDEGDAIE